MSLLTNGTEDLFKCLFLGALLKQESGENSGTDGRQLCVARRENLLWMRGGICQGEGRWESPGSVTCLVWAPKELGRAAASLGSHPRLGGKLEPVEDGRFLTLQTEAWRPWPRAVRRLTRLAKEYKVCVRRG